MSNESRIKLKFSRPGTIGAVQRNFSLNDHNSLVNTLTEQCGSFLQEVTIVDISREAWVQQVVADQTNMGFHDWKKREQTTA